MASEEHSSYGVFRSWLTLGSSLRYTNPGNQDNNLRARTWDLYWPENERVNFSLNHSYITLGIYYFSTNPCLILFLTDPKAPNYCCRRCDFLGFFKS